MAVHSLLFVYNNIKNKMFLFLRDYIIYFPIVKTALIYSNNSYKSISEKSV